MNFWSNSFLISLLFIPTVTIYATAGLLLSIHLEATAYPYAIRKRGIETNYDFDGWTAAFLPTVIWILCRNWTKMRKNFLIKAPRVWRSDFKLTKKIVFIVYFSQVLSVPFIEILMRGCCSASTLHCYILSHDLLPRIQPLYGTFRQPSIIQMILSYFLQNFH